MQSIIIKVIWLCSVSHTKHLMVLHIAFFTLGWHEMKQYLYDEMERCRLCAFDYFVRVTWTQVLWAWWLLSYSRVGNAYSVDTLNQRMAHRVWQCEINQAAQKYTLCVIYLQNLQFGGYGWQQLLETKVTPQAKCVPRAMKKGLEGLKGKLAYIQGTFYFSALPISPQCFMAYLVKTVFAKWILDWLCSLSS